MRVEASGLGRLEGRLVASDAVLLNLTSHARRLDIPWEDVERLWSRGRATGKGALIGSLAGLAVGIAAGVFIGPAACGIDAGECTSAGLAAVMGLVGAAGGAAIGFGIGLAIPEWKLRFP